MERDPLSAEQDPYVRLEQMCGHRWDSYLLLELAAAAGPARRADLATAITHRARDRISDSQMSRTILRLEDRHLIQHYHDGRGHKVYRLTPTGTALARGLSRLGQLLDQDVTALMTGDHPADPAPAGPVGEPPYHHPAGDLDRFVQEWLNSLRDTALVPLTSRQRHRVLTSLAHRLRTAAITDPVDRITGRQVGAQLVTAGFAVPAALGRSIRIITTRLVGTLDPPDRLQARERLTSLVADLAEGFTEAVRARTLNEQEGVRTAAIHAHERAGQLRRTVRPGLRHHAGHLPPSRPPRP